MFYLSYRSYRAHLTHLAFAVALFALCALAPVARCAEPAPVAPDSLRSLNEPDPARDARIAWHKDARFGCFMHWGVYSELGNEFHGKKGGGYAEHIMRVLKIPRQVYLDEVVRNFDPVHFDADAWVRLIHDAGMRYLVITAKHHDGFAMYPSKASDYNIRLTKFPKDRDIMAELSAACKKYGLKFGFYYSHAFDWEHPDAPGNDWDYDNPGGDRKLHGTNWWETYPEFLPRARKYVDEKSIPQIRELIEMYHPDIMWFDTPGKLPPEENHRILAAVRRFGPEVVVNGRLDREYGDYKNTGDRPAYFPETKGQWESIPTTNESYGYNKFDLSHKSPEHFVRLLAMTVGKGGNMLLNIGPRGDGTIDPPDVAILDGIGAWMKVNSESIYGCDRTPLAVQNWGTSTSKGNRLYLHVFDWPKDGRLIVGGLKSTPASISILGVNGAVLGKVATFRRLNDDDLELTLPATAPDKMDSVIVLDFADKPVASKTIRLAPEQNSITNLHVMDGALSGKGIGYGDGKRGNDVVNVWSSPDATVTWKVRVPEKAWFKVVANYNTTKETDGGTLDISVDSPSAQTISLKVTPTRKAGDSFRSDAVGELMLDAGEYTITARPANIAEARGNLMRLRQLELTPIVENPKSQ